MNIQFPQNQEDLPKWFDQYIGRGYKHITETKLASLVGVSQKSISRYAHGESYPKKSVQNKIVEVINGLITPEDVNHEAELYTCNPDGTEFDEIYQRADDEKYKSFSRLSREKQLILLRNPLIGSISYLEISFIDKLNELDKKRKAEIISFMESFSLSFSELTKDNDLFSKIRLCLDMMDDLYHIEKISERDPRTKSELQVDFSLGISWSNYEASLATSAIYLSAYDWYVLKLFIICEIKDQTPRKYILFGDYPDATVYVGELIYRLYSFVAGDENDGQ